MYKILGVIFCCLLMICCSEESHESYGQLGKQRIQEEALEMDYEEEIEPPRTSSASPPYSLEKGSKMIKRGMMQFEVDKLEAAKSRIDSVLTSCNGYYENEQYNAYGNRVSYSLQLRIPNAKFDSLINIIEGNVGKLTSKNISAKDVTEEYVDLNIRLENNLAYLSQYKEILRKAKSVKEILEVQEKIRRIEEEINSKKGRIKYLDDKVKYSTLNLEITQLIKTEVSNKPGFGMRLVNAFNNGVQAFLSFIVGLVNLWPFILLGFLMFLGRKSILNRFRRQRKSGE